MNLIIGATGQVGREVVRALRERGERPIAAARKIEKARKLLGEGVTYRLFDYEEQSSWLPALSGIQGLFFIAPPNATDAEPTRRLLGAAALAGVRFVLFHSGRTTGDVEGSVLNQTEQAVRESGLDWCILRPGWFMQNFLSWAGATLPTEEALMLPAGEAASAFVDVRDLGRAAAEVFLEPGIHLEKTYELTGLEAHTHRDVAQILSEELGREIRYEALSKKAYVEKMLSLGWQREDAEFTAGLYRYVAAGKEAEVSTSLAGILGAPPAGFRDFVQRRRGDFKKLWKSA